MFCLHLLSTLSDANQRTLRPSKSKAVKSLTPASVNVLNSAGSWAVNLSWHPTADSAGRVCVIMQDAGALKAGLLAENKSKLRQAKQHARELSLAINATKRQIDALKASEEAAPSQQVTQTLCETLHAVVAGLGSCSVSVG